MMKYVYLLCVSLLVCCNSLQAQTHTYTYSFSPADSLQKTDTIKDSYGESDIYIYVHNTGDTSVKLFWRLLEDTVPTGWTIGICDNITCYSNYLNSLFEYKTSDPILKDSSAFIKAVFTPNCISGTGIMKVEVSAQGGTNQPDTFTYRADITADCAAGIHSLNDFQVHIYPNPSSDLIYINGLAFGHSLTLDITDMQGRILQTLNQYGKENMKADVSRLIPGFYLLKVSDAQAHTTVVGKFSKL